MKFETIRRRKNPEWMPFVKDIIRTNKQLLIDAEINFRVTNGTWLNQDVLHADECVYIQQDDNILACIFIHVRKHPRVLYVALLFATTSHKGYGSKLLHYILNTSEYKHTFCVVKSTDHAIGFYMKHDFKSCNYKTMYTCFMHRTDDKLNTFYNDKKFELATKRLVSLRWNLRHDDTEDEFGLCKRRNLESI